MTPPSQKPHLPSPMDSTRLASGASTHSGCDSSNVPLVSPSELDTSIFKSPLTSQMTEGQNDNSTSASDLQSRGTVSGSLDVVHPSNTNKHSSATNTVITNTAEVVVDKIADHNTASIRDSEDECEANEVLLDREHSQSSAGGKFPGTPVNSTLKRQSSLLSSSPRMCLSLKKCKMNSGSMGARRSLSMSDEQACGRHETSSQFVLGVNEGSDDSFVESQFQIPHVEVPNDSQFEISADSQMLFQIQRPNQAEPTVQSPVSSSQKQDHQPEVSGEGPPSSLFAFVDPNLSSRHAIKKAKESEPSQDLAPPLQSLLHCGDGNDPYQYDSQEEQTDINILKRLRAKRATSTKESTSNAGTENQLYKGSSTCPIEDSTRPRESKTIRDNPTNDATSLAQLETDKLSTQSQKDAPTPNKQRAKEQHVSIKTFPSMLSAGKSQDNLATEDSIDRQGSATSVASSQPTGDTGCGSQLSQSLFSSPSLLLPSTSTSSHFSSTSPSAVVPLSLVTELKRQAGLDKTHHGYQLKLVKVVRTITEERHFVSEIIEDGKVLHDSGKSWIVSFFRASSDVRMCTCLRHTNLLLVMGIIAKSISNCYELMG